MNYKQIIKDAGIRMLQENLTIETWGNISVRDEKTNKVYITPSSLDYRKITLDNVVVCDLAGNILEGRNPSIEIPLHLAIYKARKDTFAIVHTHPIFSTVFSCMGNDIDLIIDEAVQTLGDKVRIAKYFPPGTSDLANACVAALGESSKAALLKSHGAVCIGSNIDEAFRVARVLEVTAEILYRIKATGGTFHSII